MNLTRGFAAKNPIKPDWQRSDIADSIRRNVRHFACARAEE